MAQVTIEDVVQGLIDDLDDDIQVQVGTDIDPNTGVATPEYETWKKYEVIFGKDVSTSDLKDNPVFLTVSKLIELIIEQGVEMGDSTATKMEVQ